MRKRYQASVLAALLSGVVMASDALAAHGGGRSGGHGGGHPGGHMSGGHFGGRFAAPVRFVPRAVFFAAPVAYFPPAYYARPPVYYDPSSFYYEAAPPPVYYEQPVQGSLPPGASYPPPPSAQSYAPAYREQARTPIYFCKDGSGRTSVTNRREDMVGKDCSEQPAQSAAPPGGSYGPAARSGSAVSPSGPYAAQDALRYRFYCPDTRKYYPEVNNCVSAWLKVVPDGAAARR